MDAMFGNVCPRSTHMDDVRGPYYWIG